MEAIIFVGIQGSGKSTFYQRRFFRTHIRLNLDMLKTRHRERILMGACIESKQSFVVDNTNVTRRDRRRYLDALRGTDFTVKCYYFRSRLDECLERNRMREGEENIPDAGVRGSYGRLEIPSYKEGFDALFHVHIEDSEFVVRKWVDER